MNHEQEKTSPLLSMSSTRSLARPLPLPLPSPSPAAPPLPRFGRLVRVGSEADAGHRIVLLSTDSPTQKHKLYGAYLYRQRLPWHLSSARQQTSDIPTISIALTVHCIAHADAVVTPQWAARCRRHRLFHLTKHERTIRTALAESQAEGFSSISVWHIVEAERARGCSRAGLICC